MQKMLLPLYNCIYTSTLVEDITLGWSFYTPFAASFCVLAMEYRNLVIHTLEQHILARICWERRMIEASCLYAEF